jgi:hypothetical protein
MNNKIALDLDEVVASFYEKALTEVFNPYFGIDMQPDEWLSYHLEEVVNSIYGDKLEKQITTEDFDYILKHHAGDDFLERLNPLPGAIETIHLLESDGFDISYLTFRSTKFYKDPEGGTKKWMQKYDLNPTKVYFTPDKSSKMNELGINILVDDMPHAVLDVAKGKKALLFSYPWNSKTDKDHLLNKKTREEKHNIIDKMESNENIIRVHNWQEIYYYLTNSSSDIDNFNRVNAFNTFN